MILSSISLLANNVPWLMAAFPIFSISLLKFQHPSLLWLLHSLLLSRSFKNLCDYYYYIPILPKELSLLVFRRIRKLALSPDQVEVIALTEIVELRFRSWMTVWISIGRGCSKDKMVTHSNPLEKISPVSASLNLCSDSLSIFPHFTNSWKTPE